MDENAADWTRLARQGYDRMRDLINTPAFLDMLPDVKGLRGLDIGCGEGYNTRQVAQRGAQMTAIDISEKFLNHARELEIAEPLGIRYLHASALELPFGDGGFDFAMATMSLMDVPEHAEVIDQAFRILKPADFCNSRSRIPVFKPRAGSGCSTKTAGAPQWSAVIISGRSRAT